TQERAGVRASNRPLPIPFCAAPTRPTPPQSAISNQKSAIFPKILPLLSRTIVFYTLVMEETPMSNLPAPARPAASVPALAELLPDPLDPILTRPLALHHGRAYAAVWPRLRRSLQDDDP